LINIKRGNGRTVIINIYFISYHNRPQNNLECLNNLREMISAQFYTGLQNAICAVAHLSKSEQEHPGRIGFQIASSAH
jgi:hypothetical protein